MIGRRGAPIVRHSQRSFRRSLLVVACGLLFALLSSAPALLPLAYEDARALAVREVGRTPVRFEIHQRVRAAWFPVPAERVVPVDRETFLDRCAGARPAASAAPLAPGVRAELLFLFDGRPGDPLWARHRIERFEARTALEGGDR